MHHRPAALFFHISSLLALVSPLCFGFAPIRLFFPNSPLISLASLPRITLAGILGRTRHTDVALRRPLQLMNWQSAAAVFRGRLAAPKMNSLSERSNGKVSRRYEESRIDRRYLGRCCNVLAALKDVIVSEVPSIHTLRCALACYTA